jgi:Restriction endonuclease
MSPISGASKVKKWEQFERLVAAIHGAIDPAAVVTWNDSINSRQFDVTIRFRRGLYDYLSVIECKDYASAVPVGEVEAFITKAHDAKAHQAVMARSSGFQSGAQLVAQKHNVVLINLTDSPDIDLSMFGANWGPNIDAFHIEKIDLQYQDADSRSLPEAHNAMTYYVKHMALQLGSVTTPLGDLLSQRLQSFAGAEHDVYAECKIDFAEGTLLFAPDDGEFPSKPIASVVLRFALTKAKTYFGRHQFDPSLLVADVDLQNLSTGESKKISRHGLPLGTAFQFEVGTFYEQPQLSHYFYCDAIVGDVATIYLVESFQLGGLIQAKLGVKTQYANFYSPVTDGKVLERLKKRLADVKAR